jgi:mannose-6-phosphate isomerase-like protein (cupin superfamily)
MLSVLAFFLALSQTEVSPQPAVDVPRPATDVLASDIMATLQKAPPTSVSDQPIRVVDVGGYNVGIFVVNRPKASKQNAVLHDNRVSEIYYMLEGAGTLVTGGALVDPQRVPADSRTVTQINGPSIVGSSIQGGTSRRIAKGDVVIIPGGAPHWWSDIQTDIAYVVVRPDPDHILQNK